MSLSNSQFDAIMRTYQQHQLQKFIKRYLP